MNITPTILCDDEVEFAHQWERIKDLDLSVQIDVADNTITPTQTILPTHLGKLTGPKPIFHLMTSTPDKYLEALLAYKPTKILFHSDAMINWPEWQKHFDVADIGIAINPEVGIEAIEPFKDIVSEVMVMTVHPGSIGQPLIAENLDKIHDIKAQYPHLTVSVDGGINANNIRQVALAGADIAYVGSAVVRAHDPKHAYRELLKEGNEAERD